MANILLFDPATKEVKDYLISVNTGDYVVDSKVNKDELQPKSGVLINPDLTLVNGLDKRYWKVVGNSVVSMSDNEKLLVDSKEKQFQDSQKDNLDMSAKDLAQVLIDLGIVTKKQITDTLKGNK